MVGFWKWASRITIGVSVLVAVIAPLCFAALANDQAEGWRSTFYDSAKKHESRIKGLLDEIRVLKNENDKLRSHAFKLEQSVEDCTGELGDLARKLSQISDQLKVNKILYAFDPADAEAQRLDGEPLGPGGGVMR